MNTASTSNAKSWHDFIPGIVHGEPQHIQAQQPAAGNIYHPPQPYGHMQYHPLKLFQPQFYVPYSSVSDVQQQQHQQQQYAAHFNLALKCPDQYGQQSNFPPIVDKPYARYSQASSSIQEQCAASINVSPNDSHQYAFPSNASLAMQPQSACENSIQQNNLQHTQSEVSDHQSAPAHVTASIYLNNQPSTSVNLSASDQMTESQYVDVDLPTHSVGRYEQILVPNQDVLSRVMRSVVQRNYVTAVTDTVRNVEETASDTQLFASSNATDAVFGYPGGRLSTLIGQTRPHIDDNCFIKCKYCHQAPCRCAPAARKQSINSPILYNAAFDSTGDSIERKDDPHTSFVCSDDQHNKIPIIYTVTGENNNEQHDGHLEIEAQKNKRPHINSPSDDESDDQIVRKSKRSRVKPLDNDDDDDDDDDDGDYPHDNVAMKKRPSIRQKSVSGGGSAFFKTQACETLKRKISRKPIPNDESDSDDDFLEEDGQGSGSECESVHTSDEEFLDDEVEYIDDSDCDARAVDAKRRKRSSDLPTEMRDDFSHEAGHVNGAPEASTFCKRCSQMTDDSSMESKKSDEVSTTVHTVGTSTSDDLCMTSKDKSPESVIVHTSDEQYSDDKIDYMADKLVKSHSSMFRMNVPFYKEFDTLGDKGIPYLAKYFKDHHDKINCPHSENTDYERNVDLPEFYHVNSYLTAKEFNFERTNHTNFDHVVDAIFSYMLCFSVLSLELFGKRWPQHSELVSALITFKTDPIQRLQIHVCSNGIPLLLTAPRLLKRIFVKSCKTVSDDVEINKNELPRRDFNFVDFIRPDFVAHIRSTWKLMHNNLFDAKSIAELLTRERIIPYSLPNIDIGLLYRIRETTSNESGKLVKYITGQACVGKTTLLKKFERNGWRIFSRGKLGTFSGKANSPIDRGNLHAAIDFILRLANVLGGELFNISYVLCRFSFVI